MTFFANGKREGGRPFQQAALAVRMWVTALS
jgi:hypothetical protein